MRTDLCSNISIEEEVGEGEIYPLLFYPIILRVKQIVIEFFDEITHNSLKMQDRAKVYIWHIISEKTAFLHDLFFWLFTFQNPLLGCITLICTEF